MPTRADELRLSRRRFLAFQAAPDHVAALPRGVTWNIALILKTSFLPGFQSKSGMKSLKEFNEQRWKS